MRRGFKTEAERLADRTRAQLGLQPHSHMPIRDLAKHLNIDIYAADELVDPAALEELNQLQPGAFSAATFHLPDGRTVTVYNPYNETGRTNSDVAHEIAHVLLNHEVRELQQIGGHTFFTCNQSRNRKPTGSPAAFSSPRALLLREAFAGSDPATIAERHRVSVPMARFRLNASGVLLQAQHARSSRARR